MTHKSIYEWAKEYCGDPSSHEKRGAKILGLLCSQEGLKPEHKVLDVGCGALSQGAWLIQYLNKGNYTGLDPNGWLIEAALDQMPNLLQKDPDFQYRNDFVVEGNTMFDYIVSHSVLSHVAQWQLEQALAHLRNNVREGARWYASLRLDQYDLFARHWQYPGVSYFRAETVKVLGWHAGWHVEQLPHWREALVEVAPNDFHDWIRLTAVPTSEEINIMRQSEEAERRADEGIMKAAKDLYANREAARLQELAGQVDD